MLFFRATVGLLIAPALALTLVGCGDSTPTFDSSTAYTPASLAHELAFRYKALNPDKRNIRKPQPPRKADAAATKEAQAATKEAQATTLDDLIRDVTAKAGSIPGMTPAEALRRVADEVGKDASVGEADRQTIADRLRGEGG